MKDEVLAELPDILKEHTCTMKKASTDSAKNENMTECMIKVIDFDKIPNEYSRGKAGRQFQHLMMLCTEI